MRDDTDNDPHAHHGHSPEEPHGQGAAPPEEAHEHGHAHAHGPANYGRAFAVGIALNTVFVVVELVYGVRAGSMALVADAGHNLSDVAGLLLAWWAHRLALRAPTKRRTYGYKRSSILAALANAVLILLMTGAVVWEAAQRLRHPEPVAGVTMIVVAAIGVAVNAGSAFMFMAGRKGDLNIRAAFLHLAADAGVSLGVVVAGLVILRTQWDVLDPVVSLLISAVVLYSTWRLLRESLDLAMDAVPPSIDPEQVAAYLGGVPEVCALHDVHIWAMSTTETAMTAHLVLRPGVSARTAAVRRIERELHRRFKIHHVTLQTEVEGDEDCELAPADVV